MREERFTERGTSFRRSSPSARPRSTAIPARTGPGNRLPAASRAPASQSWRASSKRRGRCAGGHRRSHPAFEIAFPLARRASADQYGRSHWCSDGHIGNVMVGEDLRAVLDGSWRTPATVPGPRALRALVALRREPPADGRHRAPAGIRRRHAYQLASGGFESFVEPQVCRNRWGVFTLGAGARSFPRGTDPSSVQAHREHQPAHRRNRRVGLLTDDRRKGLLMQDRPTIHELALRSGQAVPPATSFPATEGRRQFLARVAASAIGLVERRLQNGRNAAHVVDGSTACFRRRSRCRPGAPPFAAASARAYNGAAVRAVRCGTYDTASPAPRPAARATSRCNRPCAQTAGHQRGLSQNRRRPGIIRLGSDSAR